MLVVHQVAVEVDPCLRSTAMMHNDDTYAQTYTPTLVQPGAWIVVYLRLSLNMSPSLCSAPFPGYPAASIFFLKKVFGWSPHVGDKGGSSRAQ